MIKTDSFGCKSKAKGSGCLNGKTFPFGKAWTKGISLQI